MTFQKEFNRQETNIITRETCPNCWGHLEWGGKYYPKFFNIDKGANALINSRNGFIRKFVKKFIR